MSNSIKGIITAPQLFCHNSLGLLKEKQCLNPMRCHDVYLKNTCLSHSLINNDSICKEYMTTLKS